MDMTREQATSLVNQVQNSHRLLAGFYRRLLPALDEMAAKFGAGFWFWDPINFDRPCRSATKPSSKWAWDYLPLLNAQFVYARTDEEQQAVIQFQLHTDPSVLKRNRQSNGQPDPLSLPDVTPAIRIYAYWLNESSVEDIKQQWEEAEYPKGDAFSISTLTSELQGTWWEVDLADFVVAPQGTEAAIGKFVTLPASDI
ncbi:hypothetical protein [Pseudomonas veronii]|uniref:hypothetical protein n=1 Tax=Pseudomonas veronii TaxID=76761 RepID=UPI0026583EBD|nr:hypothetical protein [Pseudomonas veronii]WKC46937.1 hypothetical protein QYP03_00415 [Pseudomonas veronii]